MIHPPPSCTLFPYTTLFRSCCDIVRHKDSFLCCILSVRIQTFRTTPQKTKTCRMALPGRARGTARPGRDRKSTRLNSSHQIISYAVFCLKKKNKYKQTNKKK